MHQKEMSQAVSYDFPASNRLTPYCMCDNTSCARHDDCKACMEFHRATAHASTCRYAWHWGKGKEPEFPEYKLRDDSSLL